MATKRPAPPVHPSRSGQVPSEPSRKRQKPNHKPGAQIPKKAHPVNELKSRVRSLKRQLERNENLRADHRVEKERALRSAQLELDENQKAQQRSDMIGRWHKVRFFDRRKAEKRVKRAKKEVEACEDAEERAVAERKLRDSEVEVQYAIYYPLDVAYVSLFPRKKESEGDEGEEEGREVERKGDPEMWERVKVAMAEGALDALRNGRSTRLLDEERDAVEPLYAKKKPKKGEGLSQDKNVVASDEESDGGFFE